MIIILMILMKSKALMITECYRDEGWAGMGWDGMGWVRLGWTGLGWDGLGYRDEGRLGLAVACSWPDRMHPSDVWNLDFDWMVFI